MASKIETAKKEEQTVQYTLFASGLNHGGRQGELDSKNTSDDVAMLFDVITTHTYSRSYRKTSYSVESKVTVGDHLVVEDGKFSFSGMVSDSPGHINEKNYLDKDTDKDEPKRSKRPEKALEILERIADQKLLVTLVTEDNILTGYAITNLSAERTSENGGGVTFNIELTQFRMKDVLKVIFARADPKKAANKNAGTKQTADGGKVDDELKGKRSPYIGRDGIRGQYEDWHHDRTGDTWSNAVNEKSRTIKPGEKFDPKNIMTGGK